MVRVGCSFGSERSVVAGCLSIGIMRITDGMELCSVQLAAWYEEDKDMSWENTLYYFQVAALVSWALGSLPERYKTDGLMDLAFLGLAIFFSFIIWNVDFIRTSSRWTMERHGCGFLPSVGGIDNLCTLEV